MRILIESLKEALVKSWRVLLLIAIVFGSLASFLEIFVPTLNPLLLRVVLGALLLILIVAVFTIISLVTGTRGVPQRVPMIKGVTISDQTRGLRFLDYLAATLDAQGKAHKEGEEGIISYLEYGRFHGLTINREEMNANLLARIDVFQKLPVLLEHNRDCFFFIKECVIIDKSTVERIRSNISSLFLKEVSYTNYRFKIADIFLFLFGEIPEDTKLLEHRPYVNTWLINPESKEIYNLKNPHLWLDSVLKFTITQL